MQLLRRLSDTPHNLLRLLFGSKNALPKHVTVGRHSYGITPDTFYNATAKSSVHIGNFCSIARNVRILLHANHPTDVPSTYPFRTLMTHPSLPIPVGDINLDATTKGPVKIGHDVWIGESAIILTGSIIGTGAVIGAGAVIRGDIPPYAIVIGNPGQIIRMRFPDKDIEQLLASRWWDLPDTEIATLDDAFYQKDISFFLGRVAEAWKRCSPESKI
jgi:acetyltransferase-like isoleucine patch superfamily enzyme